MVARRSTSSATCKNKQDGTQWQKRRFHAPAGSDETMFEKHVAPWLGRFFTDLSQAETAKFYRHVCTLGRAFIENETEALALTG